MRTVASLILLALASQTFALPHTSRLDASCQAAYDACMFTFEGAGAMVPTYKAGQPDTSITPPIVLKGDDGVSPSPDLFDLPIVGYVDSTGPTYVILPTGAVLISKLAGPSPPFAETFVKATPFEMGMSGLGHQAPSGDQIEFLDGVCVLTPITKYQLFTDGVIDNVESSDTFTSCAVFYLTL
eukprot:CAMPEP_0198316634 /NCGR_PEP_ID=MMETSP1450-20131203/6456_1 /TAXON_ID=753684 ORGANISM="Madagascaria erythrocladiodes, Strain CCMP3234" /NCGR_SAMPLE_ID=MMETSP1450 /ASSEMBLY_ACC=CAM_ASM_001115 /LENGTH=182 /DNA_ID=CAMNT_0044019801 /DNA_START=97 /DNA_END=645 /DNA_ORIENTATION=+